MNVRLCLASTRTTAVGATALAASARAQSGFGAPRVEQSAAHDGSGGATSAEQQQEAAAPYRRRTSDPQTLRERSDFRRDHKYGRHRPLPDAPWRQHKERTYLDDAERLYGRKETWHAVESEELREKLVAILQDYLRDTVGSARLEARDATKYKRLCESSAREYRANIRAGAFGSADMLRHWAAAVMEMRPGRSGGDTSGEAEGGTPATTRGVPRHDGEAGGQPSPSDGDGSDAKCTAEQEERLERRRRRGAEAVLDGSAAMADLPDSDSRNPQPLSAFPFLRQRAVEGEHTLDPSLADWTAKYFPADDEATFREPPQLRQRQHTPGDGGSGGGPDDSTGAHMDAAVSPGHGDGGDSRKQQRSSGFGPRSSGFGRGTGGPQLHARHRLNRSLRAHEDRHRATFDAEGVFYHLRQQSDDDERAPRPRPVRGSDVTTPGARGDAGVVKVPWNVVSASKQQGYTPDILRAKERLIRLSRGEDPETMP